MSAFGKILAPITVPAGGWTFAWVDSGVDGAVTVPVATYATALHLAAALETVIDDDGYTSTVTVSSTGTVTITITTMTGEKWASTTIGLRRALGFDGTETVSSHALVSSTGHRHGWYPGVISLDSTRGVGLVDDSDWIPVDVVEGVVAGSGAQSIVGPVRPPYERLLVFGKIHRDEGIHRTKGPICLLDRWRYSELWWYPDRDDGAVGSYGTQGDPGTTNYDTDDDCDYWLVTVVGSPQLARDTERPDLMTCQVRLNAEPRILFYNSRFIFQIL